MKKLFLSVALGLSLFANDSGAVDGKLELIKVENPQEILYGQPISTELLAQAGEKSVKQKHSYSGSVQNISQYRFNSATDSEVNVTSGGQTVFSMVYTTAKGGIIDMGNSSASTVQPSANSLPSATRSYFNSTVWNSNSFGGWVYFDSNASGYNGGCTLASRNTTQKFFNVTLGSDGILSVTSQITNWSTGSVRTTSAIPMNEWVYIQAYHSGSNYKVGWKKTDGTQHVVQGTIIPLSSFKPNTYDFPLACVTKATSLFWQPGDDMFVNAAVDVSSKYIHEAGDYYNILTTQFVNSVYSAIQGVSNPFPITTLNRYVDNNGQVVLVDFR